MYFVYDSYHIAAADWAEVLGLAGAGSLRGTEDDGTFIGLWLEANHGPDLAAGHFDGAYTYFASEGFSWGSSLHNWPSIRRWAEERSKLFVASVGPGYDDTGIRPWNAHNTKDREKGKYYRRMWEAAIQHEADMVSITSYNEWGEGTQIEPAVRKTGYEDPGDDPNFYLQLTADYADELRRRRREQREEREEL